MKKWSLILVAAALTAALAGCAGAPVQKEEPPAQQTAAQGERQKDENTQPSAEEAGVTLTGKVSGMVGNEMELELGTLAGMEPPAEGDGEVPAVAAAPAITVTTQEEGDAADAGEIGEENKGETVFAIEGEGGNVQVVGKGVGGGTAPELTYTGESKTLTIPAGAKITNLAGGESTLAAIKKGAVVMVIAKGNAQNPVVQEVMILG